ncbi:DNA-directed RNA polymerase specialized sigma24 family protein [Bradyrhizobium sp. GM24.11]
MADKESEYATWLAVIGRALARLALERATVREPDKYREVLDKVKFLEGLGLPQADAAEAAGSTAESVRVT